MHPRLNNIGAFVDTANVLYQGAALSAGAAAAGTALTFTSPPPRSLVLTTCFAGTTGTPTAASVALAVESGDGTNWHTVNNRDGNAVTLTVTAANKVGAVDVDTQYMTKGDDRIRVTPTVAFTDGTTPTAYFTVTAALGGEDTLPT